MIADHFAQAMAAAGMTPPDSIHADGQLHRFSPTGRRSDWAGWYVLHADGLPAGVFGCWRTGLTETWCSKAEGSLTPAERDAMRQRVRAAKALRDAALLQRQQQAQAAATARWRAALPAARHPYLTTKGIAPYNLRVDGCLLLVPLRDTSGMLHSLQTIAPDGSKRLMGGGRVRGCYHSVGCPDAAIVVGEGMATMHSVHAATGLAVAAALSTSNLTPVAVALRRKFPLLPILMAADDDHATEGNPGLSAARAAALAVVGAQVVVPQFPADPPRQATDFNDLFCLAGAGAVRACFAEVLELTP
ncbi:DNA primase TraC [Comamonas sp. PE63]|uniref:DNA primase TraC n=1 Tax=Comamonas brasiliensis TaxID=1812482 RepID=A0ABS5LYQ6_9BURK|nr:toprim domain-containing protein [Comamonas sp. PE63]MBS3021644.1 DNA primase TraC [Comamonas sp. PE63]